MPEPLTDAYLKTAQNLVLKARPGTWEVHLDNDGQPAGFGPFPWVDVWDEAELVPNIEFGRRSRDLVRDLLGEVARLKTLLSEREFGPAFGWAARMDADDLEGFLAELSDTAAGDDDLSTLQRVEETVREWHLIAVAQHAHNTAQEAAS